MKKPIVIIFMLIASCCYSQDSTVSFESSKGNWNFPVATIAGIDTTAFDCVHLPSNSSLYLTIISQPGVPVQSVQDGKVVTVREVGSSYMIIIKAGQYFLVYDGISKPRVTEGSYIFKGNDIGNLAEKELNLILMKGPKTININRWFNWNLFCSYSPEAQHPKVSL